MLAPLTIAAFVDVGQAVQTETVGADILAALTRYCAEAAVGEEFATSQCMHGVDATLAEAVAGTARLAVVADGTRRQLVTAMMEVRR